MILFPEYKISKVLSKDPSERREFRVGTALALKNWTGPWMETPELVWKIQPGDQGPPLGTCGAIDPLNPSRIMVLTWMILPSRGYLVMSGDIFGCHTEALMTLASSE